MYFSDRLEQHIQKTNTAVCVGIDPAIHRIPEFFLGSFTRDNGAEEAAEILFEYSRLIIDSVFDLVSVVKPQAAYFERYGSFGVRALERIFRYAKDKGLITVLDAKRNDIAETAKAYADGYLSADGPFQGTIDSITLNPYLGSDSIEPFVDVADRNGAGLFVCVRTSNPGSRDIQCKMVGDKPLYGCVSDMLTEFSKTRIGKGGYSNVGAVVGATCAGDVQEVRRMLPNSIFLVPGLGAQGGSIDVLRDCFDERGMGAIINNSRGLNYPPGKYDSTDELAHAIHRATQTFINEVNSVRLTSNPSLPLPAK